MAKLRKIQHLRTSISQYVEIEKGMILDIQNVPTYDSVPTSQELISMVNPPKYIFIPSTDKYYTLQGKKPEVQILDYGEIAISYGKNNEAIYLKNSDNEIVEISADVTKQIVNILSGISGNTVGISDEGNIEVAITQEHGKISKITITETITEELQDYVDNTINNLDSIQTGVSNSGLVSVKVSQIDGIINDVTVTDNIELPTVRKIKTHNPHLSSDGTTCVWKIDYELLHSNNIEIDTAVVNLREITTGKQVIPDVTFCEDEQNIEISFHSVEDIEENKYLAIIIG
jgi:hypothetical protein